MTTSEPQLRCPTNLRFEGDLVGCGSTNIVGPDEEELFDCCECGLWFTKAAAEAVENSDDDVQYVSRQ
jgi:hypothetical protein